METLEIIILIGLVGTVALNVAIAVCGVQLWESVRKLVNGSTQDDTDDIEDECITFPIRDRSESIPSSHEPVKPKPVLGSLFDMISIRDVDHPEFEEEEVDEIDHIEETIEEGPVNRDLQRVKQQSIPTITIKEEAEAATDYNR